MKCKIDKKKKVGQNNLYVILAKHNRVKCGRR